jgi:hypothetical protein
MQPVRRIQVNGLIYAPDFHLRYNMIFLRTCIQYTSCTPSHIWQVQADKTHQ